MADGSIKIDTELDDKGLSKGLQNLQGKLEGTGKKLQSIGGSMTKGLTLPIVAAGTGALLMAAKFDDSMRMVKSTMGKNLGSSTQEADKNFKALREEAMKLGATTAHSASDASGAMKELAQMGYDTNQVLASTGTVLDVASASGLELDFVATTLAGSMNQFGVEVDDNGVNIKRFGDVMVRAGQMSGTSMEEIAQALEYVGSSANASGMDIEQTSAFIGILGDQSIKGSKAGTSLNAMLRDMKAKVKDGNLEFDGMNIAMYDSQGNMRDMTDIMADLETGLEGKTDAERDAALGAIFGSQAQVAVNAILGEGTDKLRKYEAELKMANDTAKIAAGEMEDGIGGALRALASATESLAITLGDVLAPIIQKIAQFVAKLFLKFIELTEGQKKVVVGVLAVLAAIGPLLTIIGTLIIVVSKVMGAFALINPVVLIVIGVIAALVAIGVLLYQNWEMLKEKATEVFSSFAPLFETVKEAFLVVVDSIKEAIQHVVEFIMEIWGKLTEFWNEHGNMLKEATTNIFGVIKTVIQTVMNAIWAVMQAIWPLIKLLIVDTWNAIKNVVQGALDVIMGIVSGFGALFTGNWSQLWESVKQVLSGAVQALWGLVNLWFVGKILKLGKSFAKMFSGVFSKVWTAIKGIFTRSLNAVRSSVSNVFNAIRSVISNVMNAIRSVISNIWNAIKSVITRAVNAVKSVVTSVFNAIRSVVTSVMNGIKSVISSVWNAIRSVISSAVNAVRSVVSSGFNAIRSVISSIMSGIRSVISSVWNGIRSTISSVVNSIKSKISSVFKSLKGIVTSAMSGVKTAVSSGIKGALRSVTSMGSKFKAAGGKIVSMIADGIKGAAKKVTGAAKNLMGKVRSFLPFSPAKEGPLTDIDKLNFGGPIEESLDKAIPDVQAKMNTVLSVPGLNPEMDRTPKARQQQQSNHIDGLINSINKLASRPASFQIEGEEVVRAISGDLDDNLSSKLNLEAYLRGEK